MRPLRLYRQSDNELFSLNEDRETYSNHMMKTNFPNSHNATFSYKTLLACGFKETMAEKIEKPIRMKKGCAYQDDYEDDD